MNQTLQKFNIVFFVVASSISINLICMEIKTFDPNQCFNTVLDVFQNYFEKINNALKLEFPDDHIEKKYYFPVNSQNILDGKNILTNTIFSKEFNHEKNEEINKSLTLDFLQYDKKLKAIENLWNNILNKLSHTQYGIITDKMIEQVKIFSVSIVLVLSYKKYTENADVTFRELSEKLFLSFQRNLTNLNETLNTLNFSVIDIKSNNHSKLINFDSELDIYNQQSVASKYNAANESMAKEIQRQVFINRKENFNEELAERKSKELITAISANSSIIIIHPENYKKLIKKNFFTRKTLFIFVIFGVIFAFGFNKYLNQKKSA